MPRRQTKKPAHAPPAAARTWAEGDAPAQPNQSVLGALELLMELSLQPGPAGTRELARRLGWNAMRVNRLLKTLAQTGMARRTPEGRYSPGAGLAVLAAQSLHASGLVRAASDALHDLPKTHGVALGVLWRDQVCYLFHLPAGVRDLGMLGTHPPFDARSSSIGRMLLALRGDDGPGLATARKKGWAYVVQDMKKGQASLAVPVGSPPVAGLALTDVKDEAEAKRLLPILQRAAERIALRSFEPAGK